MVRAYGDATHTLHLPFGHPPTCPHAGTLDQRGRSLSLFFFRTCPFALGRIASGKKATATIGFLFPFPCDLFFFSLVLPAVAPC